MNWRPPLDWLSYAVNVVVVLGWLWGSSRHLFRRRAVTRFFGSAKVHIYLPLRQSESRLMIANEDFLSALELSAFLRSHGIASSFEGIPPHGEVLFAAHSIVICGPKSSGTVRDIYASDPHYVVEKGGTSWQIRERTTGNVLYSPMDREPPEDKDVAYLARVHNTQGQPILVVAGLHAAGSYGAISFLTVPRNLRSLLRTCGRRQFSVVIMTSFSAATMTIAASEVLLAPRCH